MHREAVAVVAACIEEAVSIVKAQEEMAALALKASMERARYAARKHVRQPFACDEAPRMSRAFSGSCAPAHKNTSAPKNVKGVAPSGKLAKRRKLTADMVDAMYRIPNHLVGKENLSVAPLFMQHRWARITRQYIRIHERCCCV